MKSENTNQENKSKKGGCQRLFFVFGEIFRFAFHNYVLRNKESPVDLPGKIKSEII